MTVPISIDVVSDVVCPWCYLGKRRLERGIALSGLSATVRWRPYQLDPTLPPEGKDRTAYMVAKFGSLERIEGAHETLRRAGAAEGIRFDFGVIKRAPNTLDAHRLVRWAGAEGVQDAVVTALFRAYFEDGRDVGDREVLVEVATACGMDGEAVRARLASDADADAIRHEVAEAQAIGVTGVPTFIIADRYGVVGAQAPEQIAEALRTVAARGGDAAA